MSRVNITAPARQDLDSIWDYIAETSVENANRLIARIESQSALYASQPEMGASANHFRVGLRYFVVNQFVVFYRPEPDGILVVRVLHGSRDLLGLFDPKSRGNTP